jgi:hypothetical protein
MHTKLIKGLRLLILGLMLTTGIAARAQRADTDIYFQAGNHPGQKESTLNFYVINATAAKANAIAVYLSQDSAAAPTSFTTFATYLLDLSGNDISQIYADDYYTGYSVDGVNLPEGSLWGYAALTDAAGTVIGTPSEKAWLTHQTVVFPITPVFRNAAPAFAKRNQEYLYNPEIMYYVPDSNGAYKETMTKPDGLTISLMDLSRGGIGISDEFLLNPKNTTVDPQTGILRSTLSNPGLYYGGIQIVDENGNFIGQHTFAVHVFNCDNPAVLSGTVNGSDGLPVQYGEVYLYSPFVDSLGYQGSHTKFYGIIQNGRYEVMADEGRYNIFVNGYGIDSLTGQYKAYLGKVISDAQGNPVEYTVACDDKSTVDILLDVYVQPKQFTVSGIITDKATGQPIPNVYISFNPTEFGNDPFSYNYTVAGITDAQGVYTVMLTENVKYSTVAEYNYWSGFSDYSELDSMLNICYERAQLGGLSLNEKPQIIEVFGDSTGLNGTLQRCADANSRISGTLVDEKGNDLLGYIYAVPLDGTNYDAGRNLGFSAGDGKEFNVRFLRAGRYILAAFNAMNGSFGYYVAGATATMNSEEATIVQVQENQTVAGVRITLPEFEGKLLGHMKVQGAVMDTKSKAPVANAMVYAKDMNGSVIAQAYTDAKGNYTLQGLPEGTFTVSFDHASFVPQNRAMNMANSPVSEMTVNVELARRSNTTTVNDNTGNAAETTISVAPNPAASSATLAFAAFASVSTVQIVDMRGNEMLNFSVPTQAGMNNTVALELSSIPSGMYTLRIVSGNSVKALPLSIIR